MHDSEPFRPLSRAQYQERLSGVRLALFDVDGVLTDGRLYLGADGSELKSFHTRDGQGLAMLRQSGIAFGVISGRSSPAVRQRLEHLGAAHVVQGCDDKRSALETILSDTGLAAAQVSFLGDDLPDIPALLVAGVAVAVADADPGILPACHWRTGAAGGVGAVREFCEDLLAARGLLEQLRLAYVEGG